jgi:hypothetical protein
MTCLHCGHVTQKVRREGCVCISGSRDYERLRSEFDRARSGTGDTPAESLRCHRWNAGWNA